MKALVSIHDLMPSTLDRVKRILDWLCEKNVPPVSLLVVPGQPWRPSQIDYLRQLAASGHELVAHGWHHTVTPRRLSHRIHSALISRNVAEHLDLDSSAILDLLKRAQAWFLENELPPPKAYVPPAWALGPIHRADLSQAPYEWIEVTRGLIQLDHQSEPDGKTDGLLTSVPRLNRLPLTGYEADTAIRASFLRRWNSSQMRQAQRQDRVLRLSIHPNDLELRLADQLTEQIDAIEEFLSYRTFKQGAAV